MSGWTRASSAPGSRSRSWQTPGRQPRCAASATAAADHVSCGCFCPTRVSNPAFALASSQTDLQAAELAKRGLEAERQELLALREELRQQQAQASAEALRLAELQQVGGSTGGVETQLVALRRSCRCCRYQRCCRYIVHLWPAGRQAAAQTLAAGHPPSYSAA